MLTDQQYELAVEAAHKLGAKAGENVAGWWEQDSVGGRVSAVNSIATAYLVLNGLEDGDPQVLDSLPWLDLSGQWADGPNPSDIVAEILSEANLDASLLDDVDYLTQHDDLITEYQQAYDQAVQDAVAQACRRVLS